MIFYLKYKQLKEEVKKVEKENKMLRIKLSHTTKLRKQNIENHKLKKEVNDLRKYVRENPEKVTNYKILFYHFVINGVICVLLISVVLWICFFMNIPYSYKRFLLPLLITISGVIFNNISESSINFLEKRFLKNSKHSDDERPEDLLIGKILSNVIYIFLIALTLLIYNNSPVYHSTINSDNNNIEFKGLGKKEKKINEILKNEYYQIDIKEKEKNK
ncbi:hypothetical protein HWI12_00200 [Staphylococcus epidermidis]|uniref:Uncharacterized protein n=1 Tax=Staphylococcus epidermidis TaxID=1282 RepID=A0A8X8K6T3_STAEP|nr:MULTISPECIES: hypothetical protein [Staphylococcus]EJE44119.1 hypothetical protein HMPREF1386_10049 [Staphylococcus epidermidis NIH051668]KAB2167458.1 hypothetical protein F9B37_08735 [Staphylococcus epidermidis]KAB2175116.1 hypothetical protein F9B23_08290 [Staphylococcus epidermidis]KAB2197175.1 hypothetical protein F9B22_09175 [Staphylococcus epidermidis]KAB2201562.1 hypothetical protein F9B38_08130 [Staphylococcus epidermidis]